MDNERQRLGVNQIMVLNSFCSLKMKILEMVVENVERSRLDPVKERFDAVEEALSEVLDNMEENKGEGPAERELRMRGSRVLFKRTKESLDATQEELNSLSQWFSLQRFEQRERQMITKALADLDEILRSNLYIMGDESARDAYDEFIDPNS
jgi:hypothetical protein